MAKPSKATNPAAAAIAAAQATVEQLSDQLAQAKANVARLEAEISSARAKVRESRVAFDAALPQCQMVTVRWRSGTAVDSCRVAILKKTPGGVLVTRRVGDAEGSEYRFKWSAFSAKFVQAEKSQFLGSDMRELRDVPTAFVPADSSPTHEG